MFIACVLTSSRSGHFDCAVGFDWALTMQGNIVAATIQLRNASLNALRPQRELRVIHNPWPRTIVFESPFTLITLVQNISSLYSSTGLVRSRPSGLTRQKKWRRRSLPGRRILCHRSATCLGLIGCGVTENQSPKRATSACPSRGIHTTRHRP